MRIWTLPPNQPVTRGQLAKMAVDGLGVQTVDPAKPRFPMSSRQHLLFVEGTQGRYHLGLHRRLLPARYNLTRQQGIPFSASTCRGQLQATGVIKDGANTYSSLQAWYNEWGRPISTVTPTPIRSIPSTSPPRTSFMGEWFWGRRPGACRLESAGATQPGACGDDSAYRGQGA